MSKIFSPIVVALMLAGCVRDWTVREQLDAAAQAQDVDADAARPEGDDGAARPEGEDDAGQDAVTERGEPPAEEAGAPEPPAGCMAPAPLCRAGDSVGCTTSCGSSGTGECSETCGAPPPSACEPPAESCNARDDDCDGLADEGRFWTQQPPMFTPITQSGFGPQASPVRAMLELAPRTGGGAWLFYTARHGAIEFARLDAAGRPQASSTLDGTGQVSEFVSDEEGGLIALASAEGAAGAAASRLRVRLLRGTDLASVAEFEPIAESGMAYRLFSIARLDVASGAPAGRHVLVVYGEIPGNGTASPYTMKMRVFTLDEAQDARSVGLPVDIGSVGVPGGGVPFVAAKVRHIPCRDEWLLSAQFSLSSGGVADRLQRVSLDAVPIGPDRIEVIPAFANLAGASRSEAGCSEGTASQLALVFAQPGTGHAALKVWQANPRTGALAGVESGGEIDLGVVLNNARAVRWGGRWFVFGFTFTPEKPGWDAPTLVEVSDGSVTRLPLFAPGGSDPGLTNALSFFLRVDNALAVVHAGERLVAAVGAGILRDDQTALPSADPVNKPVVAASYAFGCPL
jgi:hypothetical protein